MAYMEVFFPDQGRKREGKIRVGERKIRERERERDEEEEMKDRRPHKFKNGTKN